MENTFAALNQYCCDKHTFIIIILLFSINLLVIFLLVARPKAENKQHRKNLHIQTNIRLLSQKSNADTCRTKQNGKTKSNNKKQSNSRDLVIPGIKNKKLIEKTIRYEFIPVS